MNYISSRIAKNWVEKSIIPEEDYELYHYGLFVLFSDIFLFSFSFILGMIFHIVLSSVVFFIAFFVIRRFAGGFHAKTELHCQIFSLSFLFLSIAAIKYTMLNVNYQILVIINLICTILLPLTSPADTPQKQLSNMEKKKFKKIIAVICIVLLLINGALLYFKIDIVSIPIVIALALETFLVILGRIFNRRLVEN